MGLRDYAEEDSGDGRGLVREVPSSVARRIVGSMADCEEAMVLGAVRN